LGGRPASSGSYLLAVTIASVALALCGSCGGFECNQSKWTGAYVVHLQEHAGGECGPIMDQVAIAGDPTATTGKAACTVATRNISSDQCRVDTELSCPGDPFVVLRSSIHQGDEAADHLFGVITIVAEFSSGFTCASTYDVTYSRQQ
jgi:hypothetical protein